MEKFEFHHVGIAVREIPSALAAYTDLFGYQLVSGPFDDPIQNVSVCFLQRHEGDPLLELVAPLGTNSPVDRILKKGGGTYPLCYCVPDLRRAIEEMTEKGAFLISGPAPAVAFEMREIAWLQANEAHLLMELIQA